MSSLAKRGQVSSLPHLLQESGTIVTHREQKLLKTMKIYRPGPDRSGGHEHTLMWKHPYPRISRPLTLPAPGHMTGRLTPSTSSGRENCVLAWPAANPQGVLPTPGTQLPHYRLLSGASETWTSILPTRNSQSITLSWTELNHKYKTRQPDITWSLCSPADTSDSWHKMLHSQEVRAGGWGAEVLWV